MIRTLVTIPEEYYDQIGFAAVRRRCTRSEIIREAIQKYFDKPAKAAVKPINGVPKAAPVKAIRGVPKAASLKTSR